MSEEVFNKLYSKLNPKQKEAVDTIDDPVMVIAGPGTGKTTILTLRIANILRKQTGIPASGILALTYTDSGVKRMREKLKEIIGNVAYDVEINTFHSFASAMIAEYPSHFIHLERQKQMTDVDQELLIREIICASKFKDLRPPGRPDAYLYSILQAIDESKREALSPKDLREFAEKEITRIEKDENSISTRGVTKGKLKADAEDFIKKAKKTLLLADIYERYEEVKKERLFRDYNDLIIELLSTLHKDELFLRLLQERFLYILVDEHQDTNDAQNLVIALISEFFEVPNLFIVGDEKQAIFRFQGASVENFLKLRKKWPAMKLISLDTNYRSHQSILDASFKMIEENYDENEHEDLRIKLTAGGKEKSKQIDIVTGENTIAMEDYLVKEVQTLRQAEPEATIAIIVRRNRDLERVLGLLEANQIAVSSERSIDIFHHPIGATFFNLIEYLLDPTRIDAFGRTLAAGMWGLTFDQSVEIFREMRAGKSGEVGEKIPALNILREKMLDAGSIAFIIEAAEVSGFSTLVTSDPTYVHVWRGIVTLAESLAREGSITNPSELLAALLAYKQSAEMRAVKVSVGAPDLPIRAMTAHGSKGMEFDYVFLPYANDEAWMGRARGSSFVLPEKSSNGSDMKDTRRLFYVALTRARKHVTVLVAKEESDGKELAPLRFISELESKSINNIHLERINKPATRITSKENKRDAALLSLAKKTLMDSGLSVTGLNHFLECPNKFLYESILKMPQAPSVSSTKGTAMHEALAHIWESEDRNVESIEKMIKDITTRSIDGSLLPVFEKDSIKAVIEVDAPIIAKALEEHFSSRGQIYVEKWMRAQYGYVYSGEHYTIPLHGRLDAILDKGEVIAVYDYKTKLSMSVNEIKGETKNSDGSYFRQLAYYKLLVSADKFYRGRKSEYSLVFVTPDKKGRCPIITLPVLDSDVKDLEEKIKSLLESVWSGQIIKSTCEVEGCEHCALRRF